MCTFKTRVSYIGDDIIITLGILQFLADFKIHKPGKAMCVMVYWSQNWGHAIKHNGVAYQKLHISSGYKRVTANIVIMENWNRMCMNSVMCSIKLCR